MNVSTSGTQCTAEMIEITRDHMLVRHCSRILRIDFERFPYFKECLLSELFNIQASAVGLHWPDADIDLEVDYIDNPPANPDCVSLDWWKKQRRKRLARLGAAGGSAKSPKKAAASRVNGRRGGRPKSTGAVAAGV